MCVRCLLLGIGRIGMKIIVITLLAFVSTWLRTHRSMQMEIVALRHKLGVYQRSICRPIIEPEDRVIWSWIARRWSDWKEALIIVQPRTVMAWQKKRCRAHCTKLSRAGKSGRPALSKEVRALIVRMSKFQSTLGLASHCWGVAETRYSGRQVYGG